MRKLLVALMMVAFAATAFAADVKFSGSYEVNGRYTDNYNLNGILVPTTKYDGNTGTWVTDGKKLGDADSVESSYYKQTFDLWMNVQTDKDTFFKSMVEFVDGKWDASKANSTDDDYKDNGLNDITLQRAWLGHNFGGVLLEAGLMNSGTWGYAFGDNAEGNFRVKATFDVPNGKLSVLTQKTAESSNFGKVDSEKDDADKYSIGYKGTFGGIMIAPKLDYDIKSTGDNGGYEGTGDSKTIDFDIAAGGKFGALTLEAEYQLKSTSLADETSGSSNNKDYDVYGWYLHANYNMGATSVGALSAYASVSDDDKRKGYDFGDDFDATFILDDELCLGGGVDSIKGFWANAIYATYDVNEKLNLMGKLAYATSNWDKDSKQVATATANMLDGASAWEFDAAANYAITKDLTYYVHFGYAKIDLDVANVDDPDAVILVRNGLALNF